MSLKLYIWVFVYLNRCESGANKKNMQFEKELSYDKENMLDEPQQLGKSGGGVDKHQRSCPQFRGEFLLNFCRSAETMPQKTLQEWDFGKKNDIIVIKKTSRNTFTLDQ